MFKDVMGNEITLGDYAVYFDANRNATVKPNYCEVVGFTPKKVRIKYSGIFGKPKTKLIESTVSKLIVVNDLVMTMPLEKMKETFAKLEDK